MLNSFCVFIVFGYLKPQSTCFQLLSKKFYANFPRWLQSVSVPSRCQLIVRLSDSEGCKGYVDEDERFDFPPSHVLETLQFKDLPGLKIQAFSVDFNQYCWNVTLQNGLKSQLGTAKQRTTKIKPENNQVSFIRLFQSKEFYKRFEGVQFFNKNGVRILNAGSTNDTDFETIIVEDDEQVIGVTASTFKPHEKLHGMLYDLRFKIAKLPPTTL